MAFVVYTQIKELQIQEREIYEFGNWLRSANSSSSWEDEYDDLDSDSEQEQPLNNDGNPMEYPWDDFTYIVVPDSDADIKFAITMCESVGVTNRYDINDLGRTFFVVR